MKKSKHPNKADRIQADRLLQAWLLSIGAVVGPGGFDAIPENGWPIDCPEYILETNLGRLYILPASSCADTCYECFGRFEEPARAAAVIGRHNMNEFSGKWNFHRFDAGLTPNQFASLVSWNIVDCCMSDRGIRGIEPLTG